MPDFIMPYNMALDNWDLFQTILLARLLAQV